MNKNTEFSDRQGPKKLLVEDIKKFETWQEEWYNTELLNARHIRTAPWTYHCTCDVCKEYGLV